MLALGHFDKKSTFVLGEHRNFELPSMTAINAVFVLLHNKFEDQICTANPTLSGEMLFQVGNLHPAPLTILIYRSSIF